MEVKGMADFITHRLVAELSLAGMGLDVLGGCYLAYDLLGGKRGPLRTIAQATGYIAVFCEFPVSLLGMIKTDKLTSVLEYLNHRRTTDVTDSTAHSGRSPKAI
jgi:hypothetical protein